MDFSGLFHQSSKDISGGGTMRIPLDDKEWPEDWITIYYKKYERFRQIPLSNSKHNADFFDLVSKRSSRREFSKRPIDLHALSTFLKYSAGIVAKEGEGYPRRAHPSGGARFPIEIYPIFFVDSLEIPAGLYHYNIKQHALDVLWERSFTQEDIVRYFFDPWVPNASFAIAMTAVFGRSQRKYGERGYRYILLEAGHIGQNMYLAAEALGIKCSSTMAVSEPELEKLIDIDGVTESVVYTMVFG